MNNAEETFEDVVFYYQTFGLEKFTAGAQEKGYELSEDFALASLDELERYIVQEQVAHTSKDEGKLVEFISCYYYLGEVFRTNFGGYWQESDRDKASIYFGQPVIAEYGTAAGSEFCPRLKVIATILRRFKDGLKNNVELEAGLVTYRSPIEDMPAENNPDEQQA